MKKKSELRRRAIMNVAAEVFAEYGFERASMDMLTQRGGGSKRTIYNYFNSKQELFWAVILQSTETHLQALQAMLKHETLEISLTLERFGRHYLQLTCSPRAQAMHRLVISEGGIGGLGVRFFQLSPERSLDLIAQFLERAMEQGLLRRSDSFIAALHLKALFEAELKDKLLLHVLETVSDHEIEAAVGRSVPAFMAAYGTH